MAETRYRVLSVALFWYIISILGPRRGPPGFERFNKWATRRFGAWQLSVLTLVGYYVARNIDSILDLHPKRARHTIYEPQFEQAARIMTSINAGFLTAKPIHPKFFRDLAQLIFSAYYIFTPDHALEKVGKFNADPSVSSIRTTFELMSNPYMKFLAKLINRRRLIGSHGQQFFVPRPKSSVYLAPISVTLWYDKPLSELKNEKKIIFHIHGGGFVSNTPDLHSDSICAWAKDTKLPIIAIDYKLAPEFPFPYGIDECYDLYRAIIESRGLCIGIKKKTPPRIVITGDSAGGNFSCVLMIKIILTKNLAMRDPVAGLVLTYPALDLGPVGLYGAKEMAYFQQHAEEDNDTSIFETKKEVIELYKSGTHPVSLKNLVIPGTPLANNEVQFPLSMSSRVLFMSDRIIPAEGLYVMVLMYIGTDRGIDYRHDPLVSPLWAQDELLQLFPRTYIICGTCDPLVDDSVIFASRLRNARRHQKRKGKKYPAPSALASTALVLPSLTSSFVSLTTIEKVVAATNAAKATKLSKISNFTNSGNATTTLNTPVSRGYGDNYKDGKPGDISFLSLQRNDSKSLKSSQETLNSIGHDDEETLDIHEDIVKIKLIKGVSHGFLQFDNIYKHTKAIYKLTGSWFLEAFEKDEYENEGGLSQQEYLDSLALLNVDASRYQNPYPGY